MTAKIQATTLFPFKSKTLTLIYSAFHNYSITLIFRISKKVHLHLTTTQHFFMCSVIVKENITENFSNC